VLSLLGVFTYRGNNVTTNNSQNTNETSINSTDSESTSNTSNQTQEEVIEEPTTETFVGKYVTATIPLNWSIVEYSNKDGMAGFADTGAVTFSGLTGLEVLNENSKVVFSFKGIDGIGGAGGCSSVARFSDTQASYIQSVKDETDALGFTATTVLDFTNTDYTEIETLNHVFRRVNNVLYYAGDYSLFFNTACGINAQFIKLDELSFTIKDGSNPVYTANAYKFGISTTVTDSETLEKLDEVLKTLKAKSAS